MCIIPAQYKVRIKGYHKQLALLECAKKNITDYAFAAKHQITIKDWDILKRETLAELKRRAKKGGAITYGEMSKHLSTKKVSQEVKQKLNNDRYHSIVSELGGDVSLEEWGEGRRFISIILVSKRTGIPGQGCFALCEHIGLCWGTIGLGDEQKERKEQNRFFRFESDNVYKCYK